MLGRFNHVITVNSATAVPRDNGVDVRMMFIAGTKLLNAEDEVGREYSQSEGGWFGPNELAPVNR